MSAFTVDISQHLENTQKILKYGPNADDYFVVDDNKNTVLKIQEILNKDDSIVSIDKAMKLVLGEEGFKKIESLNLSMQAYQNLFIGMMAAISAKSYEEMEKSFRKSQQ